MKDSASAENFSSFPEIYIDTPAALREFVEKERPAESFAACSIDTEADSMHSYETKLCLIQFSLTDCLAIIDPLSMSVEDLGVFTRFVDRFDVVWMHGGDYDISLFRKTFDWAPASIFDTQIAARMIGVKKFGLANLLEAEYGVKVSKQSQKADWSRRPLSDKMLAYAYDDVRYLLDLGSKYVERLQTLGRYDWFAESCDFARTSVFNRDERSEDDAWKITGWGKHSRKGLNYLKTLWYWRDEECRRLDRPAFKFLSNNEILRMAKLLEEGSDPAPPHYLRAGAVGRLKGAVSAANKVPSSGYPEKKKRGTGKRLNIDETKFENLRRHRDQVAAALDIEPTLISTRGTLERLAARNLEAEEKSELLMTWQRDLMQPGNS